MIDFLYQYIIQNYLYIQIVPALFGLYVFTKVSMPYKLFIAVLWYSIFSEITAIYYGSFIDPGVNKIFYNVYNIVYFFFLFWLYYSTSKNSTFKKISIGISLIFLSSICYEIFIDKIEIYHQAQVSSYIIGGFGVLICVFYYLVENLNADESINIFKQLLFWITLAHFIYYLGFTPFKMGENYFSTFIGRLDMLAIKVGITCLKSLFLSIGFYGVTRV